MNYLSHYFYNLEAGLDEGGSFHLGVALPDLLSGLDRRSRLDFRSVAEVLEKPGTEPGDAFLRGLLNHDRADQIFHSSPWFDHFTGRLKARLRAQDFGSMRTRSWFLAHILVELLLDHQLLTHNRSLSDRFYRALNGADRQFSSWLRPFLSKTPKTSVLEGFERFMTLRYLRHYRELDGVAEACNRILQRTRQDTFDGPHRAKLLAVLEDFNEELQAPASLDEFTAWAS